MGQFATFTSTQSFYIEHCYKCGIPFGVMSDLQRRRLEDGKDFFCPNGHSQHYTETEIQKLRKKVAEHEATISRREAQLESVRKERDTVERSRNVYRGKLKSVKTRVQHGVCPCCNRHFTNLERHMTAKHPDYSKDPVSE